MNIAIIDDQEADGHELRAKLQDYFRSRGSRGVHIDCFTSAQQLRNAQRYSLIFLDILMPDVDGMDVARALRDDAFRGALVFTTVTGDCVFEAFSVQAADYLMKPVDDSRLQAVLDRVSCGQRLGPLLVVQQAGETRVVDLSQVEYCEITGRRLSVHLQDGAALEIRGRLEQLEAQAGPGFFRCHRGYLVNLRCIAGFSGGSVRLLSGTSVPLSRLREREFRSALVRFLGQEHDLSVE